MPYFERGTFMTNGERKRIENEGRRKKAKAAEERAEANRLDAEAKAGAKKEKRTIIIQQGHRSGGHHCAHKEAGSCHGFTMRCIEQKHMGGCPQCGLLSSYKDGCIHHGIKGEDLIFEHFKVKFADTKAPKTPAAVAPKNHNKAIRKVEKQAKRNG